MDQILIFIIFSHWLIIAVFAQQYMCTYTRIIYVPIYFYDFSQNAIFNKKSSTAF